VELKLSGQRFKWTFLQAGVQMAILEIDFLTAYKLSVDPTAGKLVYDGTGLTLSTISSSSGATASAIVSVVTVPAPLDQAATSLSIVPASDKQAVPSSSSTTVTGHWPPVARPPPPVKPSSQLAALLPIFFQLLLQRYQNVFNLSKVLPTLSHGVFHHLRRCHFGGWTLKNWQLQRWTS
jgi:hypothetical protein